MTDQELNDVQDDSSCDSVHDTDAEMLDGVLSRAHSDLSSSSLTNTK